MLACILVSANGQNKKAKISAKTTTKACQSNTLSFPCPKGLRVKSNPKSDGVFVAYDSKNKIGVFAFAPTAALSEQELIDETLKNALKILYATDFKDYQWKDSEDYSGDETWSKHQVAKFAKAAFNKKKPHSIHLQFAHLSYQGKQVLAGFVYEMEIQTNAESTFNEWFGGGNGDAANALQELIIKITGEKKTETPGGPPPEAKPKSN